jgi:hypothetical protein
MNGGNWDEFRVLTELIITVKQLSATCSQFPIYIPSTVSIIKRRALVLKRKEKQKQKKNPKKMCYTDNKSISRDCQPSCDPLFALFELSQKL